MINCNYQQIIQKASEVLNRWAARSLTMIGKIQVVNTLVMSLCTHKMSCLPSPSQEFHQKLKDIIIKFIWNDRRPKIAYHVLRQTITMGGLKLIDSKYKNISCKITWVKKLFGQAKTFWKQVAFEMLPINPKFMIECNVGKKEAALIQERSAQWGDIIECTSKIIQSEPCTLTDILNQVIWYNKYISITKRQGLIDKSIIHVKDIINMNTGDFVKWEDLTELYELPPMAYLDYCAVKKAIPKNWKHTIKRQLCAGFKPDESKTTLDLLISKDKPTAWAYNQLLWAELYQDKARIVWNIELSVENNVHDWEQIRIENYKLTLSVKLCWFQYRLLSHRLTTNVTRHRWNKSISAICTFCKIEYETTLHVMYHCTKVKPIWQALQRWFKYHFNMLVECSESLVILNNYKGQHAKLINTIILIAKQYIYAQKCANEQLNFAQITQKVHNMYLDEKFISKKKNAQHKNNVKWKLYKEKVLLEM